MSFINIYTNNLSRELSNSITYVDNWVYVPGTAITGDYTKVYPITSLQDFKDTFGTRSPEGSLTYEYVAGLLSAGLPVLFRRIACTGQDTPAQTLGVTKAKTVITHEDSETHAQVNDVTITDKFGGTFGNDLRITIRKTDTAYWLDVYLKYTLLEKQKLITLNSSDDQTAINEKLINALQTVQFDRIDVTVDNTDPQKFVLSSDVTLQALTGGTDFDEAKVVDELPETYKMIQDKILYQPKFITSGGYTDKDITTEHPIADAMKNLTLQRQDCRAIIDLPIGVDKNEQQDLAKLVGYSQNSNTEVIPSASMYAPWQYMQVGTEQLWMPPSYAFLTVVGRDVSSGGNAYTPKAGLSTGRVTNIIRSEFDIGADLCDKWQSNTKVNINPIMKIQSGDYIINGNSTLLIPDTDGDIDNAFEESSADLTIIEIRRFVYNLATELQYQYNSDEAFETFSLRTAKFLNQMMSEGSLTDYDITNISSSSEPRKLKIKLDIYLTPTIKEIEIYLNVSYGSIEVSVGGEA